MLPCPAEAGTALASCVRRQHDNNSLRNAQNQLLCTSEDVRRQKLLETPANHKWMPAAYLELLHSVRQAPHVNEQDVGLLLHYKPALWMFERGRGLVATVPTSYRGMLASS